LYSSRNRKNLSSAYRWIGEFGPLDAVVLHEPDRKSTNRPSRSFGLPPNNPNSADEVIE
jgi:hypothetical protein